MPASATPEAITTWVAVGGVVCVLLNKTNKVQMFCAEIVTVIYWYGLVPGAMDNEFNTSSIAGNILICIGT